jgi:hypothetical protein
MTEKFKHRIVEDSPKRAPESMNLQDSEHQRSEKVIEMAHSRNLKTKTESYVPVLTQKQEKHLKFLNKNYMKASKTQRSDQLTIPRGHSELENKTDRLKLIQEIVE